MAGDVVADLLASGAWDVVHERGDGGILVRDNSVQRLAVAYRRDRGGRPRVPVPGWSSPP
jgi:hypothetical protein